MIERKLVELPGGAVKISGRSDDGYFQNVENHAKEMFPLASLAKRNARDATILDIGGNIGLSCIALARACPRNHVIVFEPSPRSAELIRENLKDNGIGNVEVIQAAVSDKPGALHLNEGVTSGFSHIVTDAHLGGANATLTEVPVVVLDEIITGDMAFAKIDVEGHEPNVLAGMRKLIGRCTSLIYMEFNAWCLSAFGGHNIAALTRAIFETFDVGIVDGSGELAPIGVDAIGFVYRHLVEGKYADIALRLKAGKTVPTLEGLTLPRSVFAELEALRARVMPPI